MYMNLDIFVMLLAMQKKKKHIYIAALTFTKETSD